MRPAGAPPAEAHGPVPSRPLVVDLDGTLLRTDLLLETANRFVIDRPWGSWRLAGWLAGGRASFKSALADATDLDVAALPYNQELLDWLRAEKAAGRRLVLATAAHHSLAGRIASHLGLFDEVLASEGASNLKGIAKRDMLVARYGERGFDYVGDGRPDMSVWRAAASAHVVSDSRRLVRDVRAQGNMGRVMPPGRPASLMGLLAAMRPHQWVKNLLVLVPLLAAHRYSSLHDIAAAGAGFVAFGLAASAIYLFNDLADVEADRLHPRKKFRPLAAGHLGLLHAWFAWPLLLLLAATLSLSVLPLPFTACLATYVLASVAYSFRLKRVPTVDVLALGGLYTLRIIAGAAAIGVPLSFWLLAFSMFFFVSMAFCKRYGELQAARAAGDSAFTRGRGYEPGDLPLIASLGASCGHAAVLVLALYIQDAHTTALYAEPRFIWLACPLLLFWISRTWLVAHRGQMHDDPIVFAIKDRTSLLVAGLLAVVFVLARAGT